MAIATVKRDGNWLEAYDEQGYRLCTIPAKDGLVGFTSTTISVKDGNWTYIYDEKGYQTGTV